MNLGEEIKLWKLIEKMSYFILCKILRLEYIKRNWDSFFQFFQFAVVGMINNVVFYVVYSILVILKLDYLIANTVAFIISILNSYYWNSKYVFPQKKYTKKDYFTSFIKTFMCYSITGLGVNNILLILWIEKLGINEIIAPIINLIITIPLNFILNKFWAFSSKKERE